MSESVIIAAISAMGLVLVALIGLVGRISVKVTRIGKDAAVAREHVANDHFDAEGNPINLRVEQDERHQELLDRIDSVSTHTNQQFDGVRSDIRGIRRDVGRVTDHVFGTRPTITVALAAGALAIATQLIRPLIRKE